MEVIKLTTVAQEAARDLLNKEDTPKGGLRIAVIGGGCSGLQYKIGFDDETLCDPEIVAEVFFESEKTLPEGMTYTEVVNE